MALPEIPESRVEEYLDFIANHGVGDDTGFNLIPECRLELYLDHIIKNGIPGGGSGLPEVEGSGKALVSVNGEWKEQDGYGYETGEIEEIVDDPYVQTRDVGMPFAMGTVTDFELTVGTSYTITLNDVEYNCICYAVEQGGELCFAIGGNISETGEIDFSFYPFAMLENTAQNNVAIFTPTAGYYHVKITYDGRTVHKIDPKYLPEVEVRMVVNHVDYDSEDGVYSATYTPDQLFELFSAGNVVIVTNIAYSDNDADVSIDAQTTNVCAQYGVDSELGDVEIISITAPIRSLETGKYVTLELRAYSTDYEHFGDWEVSIVGDQS